MADKDPEELTEFVEELDKITEGRVPPLVREDDDDVDLDTGDDDMMNWDLDDEEDDDEFGDEDDSNSTPVIDQLNDYGDGIADQIELPDGGTFGPEDISEEQANKILKVIQGDNLSKEAKEKINEYLMTTDGFQEVIGMAEKYVN